MTGVLQQLSGELETLVAAASPAVVSVEHGVGQGSGTVLTPDGYVLTNSHVVRDTRRLRIGFADGSELRGDVVGTDPRTDLAVVRVDRSGLSSLPLAERDDVRVGQLVVAIGNPLRFQRSVSLGVVSALDRSLPGSDATLEGLIQTDAAVNPGNSGGPLVSAEGKVVGIATAIVPYAQGIGFAVPSHTASWVASVLIRQGHIRRPLLGIAAAGVALGPSQSRELGRGRALRVYRVGPQSPADVGGLREGDLVLAADGAPVGGVDDLQRVMVLGERPEVRLDVWRDHARHELVVRPALEPRAV
jgi:serine protease Do